MMDMVIEMKDMIILAFIVLLGIIISAYLTDYFLDIRKKSEISTTSILFKNTLEIKRNCSKEISFFIREKVADGKLTFGEYDEILNMYKQECNMKDMEELLK